MIELVDTHCHIQSIGERRGEQGTRELWAKAQLEADEVVEAARANGVSRLLCVGCDLDDSQLAIDFAVQRPGCWATIGIHPHEAQHFAGHRAKLQSFSALAAQPKVVAVGECGLDFYYNHSPKADQVALLKFQIELAVTHNLPLIFHVRQALDDFWPIFDSYSGLRGVLHSFTDNAENLNKALERGLLIGVNGIATFTKDPQLLAVYRTLPLQQLLLETDSPFLTPAPHRRQVNQPQQIVTIASFLASLRQEELAALAAQTTANARQLFGI